jgi:hypothetical protein
MRQNRGVKLLGAKFEIKDSDWIEWELADQERSRRTCVE